MLPKYSVLVLSVLATIARGDSKDDLPNRYSLPLGPPVQYTPVGVDPHYQFNYIPNKEYYPSGHPPVLIYGGAGIPGQQFLYGSGAPPPGNFLIPQPGPGVMFGNPQIPGFGNPQTPVFGNPQTPVFGNPQTPVFNAGYPRPAHIPPIEKDAEEVPGLAGNHPPTRTGRPRPTDQSKYPERPQKIETFDEVETGEEVDDLEQAEKIPNNYPKKAFPKRPILRPGQQFFILNGDTLFSNVPLEQGQFQKTAQDRSIPQFRSFSQQPILINHEDESVPRQQFHRNINKPSSGEAQTENVQPSQPLPKSENYISFNNLADFRQEFLLREPVQQVQSVPLIFQEPQVQPYIIANPEDDIRFARNFHFNPTTAPLDPYYQPIPATYPYVLSYDYNGKEDDDTVTIEAKPDDEETVKKVEDVTSTTTSTPSEEPSISQAKPSALAVSGEGGVASAGPRGTALVGNKGVAVASPEATAVSGPKVDDARKKSKPKIKK